MRLTTQGLRGTLTVVTLAGAAALVSTGAMASTANPSVVQAQKAKPSVAKAKVKGGAVAMSAAALSAQAPEALGAAELAIASNVYVGSFPCELGKSVDVQADDAAPGYFHLRLKREHYHLRPVVSSTGAVRLEDPAQGAVWIQLANKSMLMSQKLGRRLVDECMGPVQRAMAEELQRHPAPHLLDVAQSPRLD